MLHKCAKFDSCQYKAVDNCQITFFMWLCWKSVALMDTNSHQLYPTQLVIRNDGKCGPISREPQDAQHWFKNWTPNYWNGTPVLVIPCSQLYLSMKVLQAQEAQIEGRQHCGKRSKDQPRPSAGRALKKICVRPWTAIPCRCQWYWVRWSKTLIQC